MGATELQRDSNTKSQSLYLCLYHKNFQIKNQTFCAWNISRRPSHYGSCSGAYGAFLVTDLPAQVEGKADQQGYNFIDSAAKNNNRHVVFNGLSSEKYGMEKLAE